MEDPFADWFERPRSLTGTPSPSLRAPSVLRSPVPSEPSLSSSPRYSGSGFLFSSVLSPRPRCDLRYLDTCSSDFPVTRLIRAVTFVVAMISGVLVPQGSCSSYPQYHPRLSDLACQDDRHHSHPEPFIIIRLSSCSLSQDHQSRRAGFIHFVGRCLSRSDDSQPLTRAWISWTGVSPAQRRRYPDLSRTRLSCLGLQYLVPRSRYPLFRTTFMLG